MKQITLIKTPAKPTKIAHLYEHLFCHTLSRVLRRSDLFPGLDCDFYGSTYVGGLIIVHFTALNIEAEQALRATMRLPFDATDIEHLDKLVAELCAEEQAKASYEPDELTRELKDIHDLPWQELETFGQFNLRGKRRGGGALELIPLSRSTTSQLTCEVSIDSSITKQNHLYLPTAYLLLGVLRSTLAEEIVNTMYYYYESDAEYFKGANARMAATFLRPHGRGDINEELQVCQRLMNDLLAHDFVAHFDGLIDGLAKQQKEFAVAEELLQQTGILVGRVGMRELVTNETVAKLLQHTRINLKARGMQNSFKVVF